MRTGRICTGVVTYWDQVGGPAREIVINNDTVFTASRQPESRDYLAGSTG